MAYFERIDTQEKAYILGLIYADGSVTPTRARLTLGEQDHTLLTQVSDAIGCRPPRYYDRINGFSDTRSGHLSFCTEAPYLHRLLGDYKERIPALEPGLWSHFVRGIFDGDGCISLDKRYAKNNPHNWCAQPGDFYILFRSKAHAECIAQLISFWCRVSEPTPKQKFGQGSVPVYKIRWGGTNNLITIREWLYQHANLYLQTKRDKFNQVRPGDRQRASQLGGLARYA